LDPDEIFGGDCANLAVRKEDFSHAVLSGLLIGDPFEEWQEEFLGHRLEFLAKVLGRETRPPIGHVGEVGHGELGEFDRGSEVDLLEKPLPQRDLALEFVR